MKDEEFAQFVGVRWMPLVRFAVLLGAGHQEAEDLAQTTLIHCYQSWTKVAAATHTDAYVSKMLLNAFRTSRRRRWWQERPSPAVPDLAGPDRVEGADPVDAVGRADLLHRALGRLGDDQREAVVLRYYLHLDQAQMVDVLGVAPGTVKSRLSRALRQLSTDEELARLEGGRPHG